MKYLIYCRKSQDREDRQILSIESQTRECHDLARKLGLDVSHILIEEKSAKQPGREVFGEMMELLEKKDVSGIVCWKLDRLARNAKDGGWVIQDIDDEYIKEIVTPGRTYRNNGDDKFWMQLEFGMAKKFVDDLSENTKRGLRATLREGRWIGWAPLGYLNIDENGKIAGRGYDKTKQRLLDDSERPLSRIELDPISAPLVHKLFEKAATGAHSLQVLTQFCHKWGLYTKTVKKMRNSTLHNILTNPFYYGMMQTKGELHEGSYEPLISKGLFDQVQVALGERAKPQVNSWAHAFKGMIKCAECGCAITATTKIKHYKQTKRTAYYTYYHCTKRKGVCSQPWITKKRLESQIAEKIEAINLDTDTKQLCLALLKRNYSREVENEVVIREQWQKKLNLSELRLKNLLQLRIDGEVNEKEYGEVKSRLLEEKTNLEEKLNDSSTATKNWLERVEIFFNYANVAYEIFKNGDLEEKRKVTMALGWNLSLNHGNLDWNYKKPFDMLLEGKENNNWLGKRNTNITNYFFSIITVFQDFKQVQQLREEIEKVKLTPIVQIQEPIPEFN